mmetsp:Transcript_20183/g.77275  ORF Transcript_20183/g.77275 Transcript_20183/m.77275 type:complete len:586 (-) Transcript_20183:36-1793(-)
MPLREENAAYAAVVECAEHVWNLQLDAAAEAIAPHKEANVSAALQATELLVWRSGIDESDENWQAAFDALVALEERVLAKYQASAPQSGALSSLSGFLTRLVKEEEKTPRTPEEIARESDYVEAAVTLADVSGAMAMLHFRKMNYVKGGYRMRKSWKFYEEGIALLKLHPEWNRYFEDKITDQKDDKGEADVWPMLMKTSTERYEPEVLEEIQDELRGRLLASRLFFGQGMFKYMVSMLPRALQWVVEIIGFEGDKEGGINSLILATSVQPSPRVTHAMAILAVVRFFFFDEQDKILALIENLLQRYPKSGLLKGTIGMLYQRLGNVEKAKGFLLQGAENAREQGLEQMSLQLTYQAGHQDFLLNNWEGCLPTVENYIAKSRSKNFKAYGGYKYGVCLWQMHGESKAEEICAMYERVVNEFVRKNMSYDVFAQRKCKEFLETKRFLPLDLIFVEVQNLTEAHHFDEALDRLAAAIPIMKEHRTQEQFALYLYCRGRIMREKEETESALKNFQKLLTIAADVKNDTWLVPYSEMEIAEILFKGGKKADLAEVQTMLQSAQKRKGYDFEKHLNMRFKKLTAEIAKTK